MALGWPEWCNNSCFATFKSRKQNEDELEKIISEWTSQLTAEDVMARLQGVGVKAGVVARWPDIWNDPQFASRNAFIPVPHPQFKEYIFTDSSFRLETARPVVFPAPLFGEHNEYVCREILGMSADEYQQCVDDKVLE
jgi:formyl-CoA transferase